MICVIQNGRRIESAFAESHRDTENEKEEFFYVNRP